jgi:hypothetical protein
MALIAARESRLLQSIVDEGWWLWRKQFSDNEANPLTQT